VRRRGHRLGHSWTVGEAGGADPEESVAELEAGRRGGGGARKMMEAVRRSPITRPVA
jgi:hypothetical protein